MPEDYRVETVEEIDAFSGGSTYNTGDKVTVRWRVTAYEGMTIGPKVAEREVLVAYGGNWGVSYSCNIPGMEEYLTRSYLVSIQADPNNNDRRSWEVNANFEWVPNAVNPLLRPAQFERSFHIEKVIVDFDYQKRAIRNAAGDPYPDPEYIEVTCSTLSWQKNLAQEPTWAQAYFNAINANAWRGFPKEYVKCLPYTVEQIQDDPLVGFTYYSVKFNFLFDPRGFRVYKLNEGTRKLVNGKATPEYDTETGQPQTEAQMLSFDGTQFLPPGSTPNFKEYLFNPVLSFSAFNSIF